MSDVRVTSNIEDFRRQLRELGNKATRRVIRAATSSSARAALPAVRRAAPVLKAPDKRRRRGALREAIYVKKPKVTAGSVTATISVRGKPYIKGKKQREGAFYWRFLEGGWLPRGPGRRLRGGERSRSLQRRRNTSAGAVRYQYPFLTRGVRQAQPIVIRSFESAVTRGIAREQAKLR
jgi:Holliday junction resolvase